MKSFINYFILFVLLAALGLGVGYFYVRGQVTAAFESHPIIQQHLGSVSVNTVGLSQFKTRCESGCERYLVELITQQGSVWAVADIKGKNILNGFLCLSDTQSLPLTIETNILKVADGHSPCR